MKKEIELSIPTDWSSLTLKQYLAMQSELKNYADDEEATNAIMLYYLCGLPVEYLNKISLDTYDMLKEELGKFINNTDYPLQRIINIDGVEYGFEPNLSTISYGAYLDIVRYDTISIDENWSKIMSILYRPITNKQRDNYTIKAYDAELNDKPFLELGMDIHFGTLFFFYNLLTDLLKDTLNSMNLQGLPPNIKLILEKSGEITHRLQNLHMKMY